MDPADRTAAGDPAPPAEQLLGLLADAVTEYAIFLLTPDGTVASWNAGAQRLKGYRAEEIVGRNFSVFYPPEDVAAGRPERELAMAASEGSCTDDGWRVRKDGTRFWAHVVITALHEGGRLRGFAKVTRDDTLARAAQARAAALADTTAALVAGHDIADVLALIARHACRLVGAAHAWIASPVDADKIIVLAAEGALSGPRPGETLPAAGTLTRQVLTSGTPLFVDDITVESSAGDRLAGAGAVLAVPLVAAETTIGVLLAVAPAGTNPFGPADLDLLRQFADQAAVVVQYERAQQALRERSLLQDRERIAHDLHTDVIRDLSWTGMCLQAALPLTRDARARERVEQAVDRLDATIRQIRQAVFEPHPDATTG